MKVSLAIIAALLAIAVIQFAYYYPQLPATVAGHFGASGAADSWQPKQAFFMLFGFVYLMFAALAFLLPRLILVIPASLVNMPNRSYWMAPERRAASAGLLADQLAWFGVAGLAFVICAGQLAINANLPGASPTMSPLFWIFLAVFLVFATWWTVRVFAMFRLPR